MATEPLMKQVFEVISSDDFKRDIENMLPPGITIDRFTQTTIVAIQHNPDVLSADRQSLYNAISRAAADGLMPDSKQGALVTFNRKVGNNYVKFVQFMPMVEGIILQLGKAGITAFAASVYANDKIEVWNDDSGQHVKHTPVLFGQRGDLIGVYAAARLGVMTYVEALNIDEIEKIRASSRSGENGPWKAWYDRMAQKSALHRLKKRLPIMDAKIVDSLRDPEEDPSNERAEPAPIPEAQAALPLKNDEIKPRRPRGLQAVVDAAPTNNETAEDVF